MAVTGCGFRVRETTGNLAMKVVAQKALDDGKTVFLVRVGEGHLFYTIDPTDPTKPHSSPFPLPQKDVDAFLVECDQE